MGCIYIYILLILNTTILSFYGPKNVVSCPTEPWYIYIWVWVNTYRYICSGMNIHKSQLFWGSLGTRVLTHPHIYIYIYIMVLSGMKQHFWDHRMIEWWCLELAVYIYTIIYIPWWFYDVFDFEVYLMFRHSHMSHSMLDKHPISILSNKWSCWIYYQ